MKNGFYVVELMIVLAIIGIVLFVPYASKAECDAKTGRIGMAHEWTLFGGCMIEEKPGRWIPLSNYRQLAD